MQNTVLSSKAIKVFVILIVMLIFLNGTANADSVGIGILQKAEVDSGLTVGGNVGIGVWPGAWWGFTLGAVAEFGFSAEDEDSWLNDLAAGASISYDRTTVDYGYIYNDAYKWHWNNFKFGPYGKYEIFDPEESMSTLGAYWAQFFLSVAGGFKINIDSYSAEGGDEDGDYLNYGMYSNLLLVDLLFLVDYPLSAVVEAGFFRDVTLTLQTGVANNAFSSSIIAWYDTDLVVVSVGWRPLIGAEVSVIYHLD